jgi:hypothetical protein
MGALIAALAAARIRKIPVTRQARCTVTAGVRRGIGWWCRVVTGNAAAGRGIMNLVPWLVIFPRSGDFSPAWVFKWRTMSIAVCRGVPVCITLFRLNRPGVS